MKITNEERIYKLCKYVMDLINAISDCDNDFEWIKNEFKFIIENIDNS